MTDMLVKLYDLPDDWSFLAGQGEQGITIRKPLGSEKHFVTAWVREAFSDAWASETDVAISNHPVSCFLAIKDKKLIGFACYDAAALGYFGPIGVDPDHREHGTGRALLLACLLEMKQRGYGYAVIGWIGPAEFYRKTVGAVEIPDSTPGVFRGVLWQP